MRSLINVHSYFIANHFYMQGFDDLFDKEHGSSVKRLKMFSALIIIVKSQHAVPDVYRTYGVHTHTPIFSLSASHSLSPFFFFFLNAQEWQIFHALCHSKWCFVGNISHALLKYEEVFYQKIELWRIYLLRSLVLWLVLPISIPCYLQYLIILDCLLKYKANIISGNLCLRHFVYFISPFKFLILICPKLLLSFHLRDISFYLFIPRTTGIFLYLQKISDSDEKNAQ